MHAAWPTAPVCFLFAMSLATGCSTSRPAKPAPATTAQSPTPAFDRIDYAHPDRYLTLDPKIGDPAALTRIAADIHGDTVEDKLRAIGDWFGRNLHLDPHDTNTWRSTDQMLAEHTFTGCADHSVLFGSIARAAGIPTVWVKTMDADWIRELARTGGKVQTWRGHVFLEVFVRDRWMLLDATEVKLQADYDTHSRILPGNRYAYDKGGDPFDLVLSPRWELWMAQTAAYFRGFDLSVLPVAEGRPLRSTNATLAAPLLIVADSPYWQWLTTRAEALGVDRGPSFNTEFEKYLPLAVGHTLVIVQLGNQLTLPERYWPDVTGVGVELLRQRQASHGWGQFRRVRSDGTVVYVLFAADPGRLRQLIEAFPSMP